MVAPIRVLDDALVDQIAAGEVVERPASVVKELLENALDAGAGMITVEIERGGQQGIRITDDGHGMSREDALLAVRRHATSKIARLEDLHAIRSLGFRGEALPSIASISQFELLTRPREAVAGTRVRIEGGGAPEVSEVGCAPGTRVDVRSLFHNVPARRKFLKKAATESAHVGDTCLRIALAHPELRLVLVRDGKRGREYLPVGTLVERARHVFSGEQLTEIDDTRDGVHVQAVLGAPEKARSGAGSLYVFVNGRAVRERALLRAIAFAYGSVLPPGRYPAGVVHLQVDPTRVDVNVHPQKAEVRFTDGRAVLEAVTRTLAAGLSTTPWSGPLARGQSYWNERLGSSAGTAGASSPQSTTPPHDTSATEPAADPWGLSGVLRDGGVAGRPEPEGARSRTPLPQAPQPPPEQPHRSPDGSGAPTPPSPGGTEALLPSEGFFGSLRVLGQVRRMLLVCEGPDGLYVLDQHAADERVRYHRLRASYRQQDVATQRLLFPERVECSPKEATRVEESRDELLGVGLDCTLVGPETIAVHSVPSLVQRASPEKLLRDVLGELDRTGERAFGDAVDMALATMACHGAIRAGDPLSPDECAALLRSMDEVGEFAGHCPHGRPVLYNVTYGELERRLGR